MKDVTVKDAIEHYRFRLAATTFGHWVIWMSESKALQSACDDRAIEYNEWAVQSRAFFCIKNLWFFTKHAMQDYQLAETMRDLLLKKSGFRAFWKFLIEQRKPDRVRIQRNLLDSVATYRDYRGRRIRKLFSRWKSKSLFSANSSISIRNAIFIGKDCTSENSHSVLVRGSLARWFQYSLQLAQFGRQMRLSIRCWKWLAKKRLLAVLSRARHKTANSMERDVFLRQQFILHQQRRALNAFRRMSGLCCISKSKYKRSIETVKQRNTKKVFEVLCSTVFQRQQRVSLYMRMNENYQQIVRIRVMRKLLQLVKARISCKIPLKTRLKMFLLHNWATRRLSAGIVAWECLIGRRRLEQRRYRMALFQYRDRKLRLAYSVTRSGISRMSRQSHKICIAESHQRQKMLRRGLKVIRSFSKKKSTERISEYRAVLCWKLWRELSGLSRLKEFVEQRRTKRDQLLQARETYALSERRAACVEMLRVAYEYPAFSCSARVRGVGASASAMTEREWSLGVAVVKRWRGLVERKRAESRIRSSFLRCISGRDETKMNNDFARGSTLAQPFQAPPESSARSATMYSTCTPSGYRNSDSHQLSRAKPRSLAPEYVPLPAPHQESSLDFRCDPAVLSSINYSSSGNSAYKYLLASARPSELLLRKPLLNPVASVTNDGELLQFGVPRNVTPNVLSREEMERCLQQTQRMTNREIAVKVDEDVGGVDQVSSPFLVEDQQSSLTQHSNHCHAVTSTGHLLPMALPISEELVEMVGQVLEHDGALNSVTLTALKQYVDLRKLLCRPAVIPRTAYT